MITELDTAMALVRKHGFLKVEIKDAPIAYTGSVLSDDREFIESHVAAEVVHQLHLVFRGGVGGILLYETQ